MSDSDDVICSGAKECKLLIGATHTIEYGDKEIIQRPENCSGRHPHRYNHEEDSPHVCIFVKHEVKAKRIYKQVEDINE